MVKWKHFLGVETMGPADMTQELRFVKDYKNNDALRRSLFELADSTFGISFVYWYQEGFWSERYIPYSLACGDQVVANVSVNLLNLIINGMKHNAVQIGTVMTHPDYRHRGLSTSLMNIVLAEYEDKADFIYLFANDKVLDFYPKFGFTPAEEHLFSMDFAGGSSRPSGIRQLNVDKPEDLAFVSKLAAERVPVSERLGTEHTHGLLMYYCLNVFSSDLYYLEDEEIIAIFKRDNKQLDLFDIISKREINLGDILTRLADHDTEKIVFHYTPDYEGITATSIPYDSGLFVRTNGVPLFPANLKHPITSIA